MSTSAINGVPPPYPPAIQPQAARPAPRVTPFSRQLDAQGTQAGAPHGQHHHHAGASNSVTSPATAASAAGTRSSGSVASALLKLLS